MNVEAPTKIDTAIGADDGGEVVGFARQIGIGPLHIVLQAIHNYGEILGLITSQVSQVQFPRSQLGKINLPFSTEYKRLHTDAAVRLEFQSH